MADEGVANGTGARIDENLNETQSPDRLDIVGRGVHLLHEAELTDSKRVREDDVAVKRTKSASATHSMSSAYSRHSQHSFSKGGARLRPRAPVN